MTLQIIDVDEQWEKPWREFCQRTPDLLIYYTWQYRTFLCDLLHCRPAYKAAVNLNGSVEGILPLMEADGRFGRVLNSLPFFGSNGGVIAGRDEPRTLLWRHYTEMLDEPGLASATIIGNPLRDMPTSVPHDVLDTRVGQITALNLAGDPEAALMDTLDSTARRNVRKAEKAGVEVEVDNSAIHELAAIHRENMQAINGRVKPDSFFALLPTHFRSGEDWNLYVARYEGSVVAGLLVFYSGRTVDYYIPGTRLEDRTIQPSALILFRAMLDACHRGCTIWNWGGTWMSQEGVLRFKRKWGAEDHPYTYSVKINNSMLYEQSRHTLLDCYGYFYTLPFDCLQRPC